MLKVKTKIGKSGVHGTGLFADEFISKGSVTWQYDPEFDTGFSLEALESLPQLSKDYLIYYCYIDKILNKYILCADNQRFINHSKTKENISSTPRMDIAMRDIQIGEEFFCDYNKFDDTYFNRMGIPQHKLID